MKSHIKCIAFLILVGALALAACWVGAGTTGIISGVVKNADGSPLSGANVFISGTQLSAVTDAKGYFAITNISPGEYEVRAEMVGYANQTQGGIQVTMDSTATADFELKQQAYVESTATVNRPRPMISTDVPSTLVQVPASQEALTRLDPTSLHAVPTALTAQPGVSLEPGGSGQIHLRGGRTDGTGYYIDGIPITDPNTGFFSSNLFSTGVSKFQMYSGGFGAEYGNAIAGVLNEVKKSGDKSPGFNMETEGGSMAYASEYAQVGGGEPDKFNYYAGSVLQHNAMEGSTLITSQRYADNTVKLVLPKKNDTITLLALQGALAGFTDNYHDTGNYDAPTAHEKDWMRQRYLVSALTWNHSFNSESFISVQPYYIYSTTVQNLMGMGMYLDAWSAQRGLQAAYTNKLNDKHLVKAGASMLQSDNNYYIYMPDYFFEDPSDPSAPVVNPYHYRANTPTFQNALYAEDTITLGESWKLQAGLRRDAIRYDRKGGSYNATSQLYDGAVVPDASEATVTPRLGVTYSADPRTVVKASWGQYSKFAPACYMQKIYFTPAAEDGRQGLGSTAPEKSTEYEISFEKQVSDSISYRVTPFWADYKNMIQAYVDTTGATHYTASGIGESKGVECLVRKRMSDNWEGWLAYTYQKSKANSSGLTDALPDSSSPLYWASWDQRHTLSLVTNYKAGRWAHSLRADYGSGRADVVAAGGVGQGRSKPNFVMTYSLSLALPKSSSVGDALNLSIYNLFNNKQGVQYEFDGADRVMSAWLPSRSISLGVSRGF